jgi:two-component system capsular synthesis response regulator RcsB
MNVTRDFRIVIADDHPVIRHAIVSALSGISGFNVGAAARSGVELLTCLSNGQWDLIVTDFSMDTTRSETDGLSLISRPRKLYPHIPVVVFAIAQQ